MQSFLCVAHCAVSLVYTAFSPTIDCWVLDTMDLIRSALGLPLIFTVLLLRIYYLLNRSKSLFIAGFMVVLAYSALAIMMFFMDRSQLSGGAVSCLIVTYPSWILMTMLSTIFVNVLLNTTFVLVALKFRYEFRESALFARLYHDGILFAAVIVLCNLTASILAYFMPLYAEIFYTLDYFIESMLLVQQFVNAADYRKSIGLNRTPLLAKRVLTNEFEAPSPAWPRDSFYQNQPQSTSTPISPFNGFVFSPRNLPE